jgi:stearoyl-CoA desaturase (delta-9 desaturase)
MNQAFSGIETLSGPTESLTRPIDYLAIVFFSITVLAALIGVPIFGLTHGYTGLDWILFGVLYVVTGLGITVGYHRLISHRSFTCSDPVKIVLLIAGGWAFQNSALKWSADHVRHHAKVDQEEDPYNATKGFWYSHVLWLMLKDPFANDKYTTQFKKDRLVVWQDDYYIPILISGFAFPFLVGLLHGGWMGGLGCFLLAGVGRAFLVLNSTFCINSICHMWGDQPNGTDNSSRDSWWISLITFGEGYHNYHHAYPKDYRNGPKWYNFDPSKWLIFGLRTMGLAENLYRVTPKIK